MFMKGPCLRHAIYIGYPYKKCPELLGEKYEKSKKKSHVYFKQPVKQHRSKRKALLGDG